MAHEHNKECEQLRDALEAARARQTLPMRDSAVTGMQSTQVVDRTDLTPSASPELAHEISNLEQQLRDLGCEG